jgi:hypothetical protein
MKFSMRLYRARRSGQMPGNDCFGEHTMFEQSRWGLAAALVAQWSISACFQPSLANSAPQPAGVIVLKPGESIVQAWHRATQAAALARHYAAIGAVSQQFPVLAAPQTAPTITAGTVVSPSLNVITPPAAPTVQFRFSAPSGFIYAIFDFTSPHGQTLEAVYTQYRQKAKGDITFQDFGSPLGLYSEAGTWTLTSAEIYAGVGVETTYDQAQLQAIFTNLAVNVINTGTQDYTPPTVTAGKILTRIVHAGLPGPKSYFRANLTVQDDVSGVNSVTMFVEPKQANGPLFDSTIQLPAPVLSGTAVSYIELYYGGPLVEGPFAIVGYGATDYAGNSFLDESRADIKALFGTPFFWVEN